MSQSELKRGTIRLLANYGRLLLLVFSGVLFVPIFIYGIGIEAFGIVGLLGAGVGIAEMCRAVVGQSMIRELGAAYHDEDPDAFPRVYNSAVVLSAAAALIVAALYGGLFLLLPVLNIPEHLHTATAWLLFAKGLLSVISVIIAPQFNMYIVMERMVLVNIWQALKRITDLLAVIVLFLILGIRDPSQGLILYGFLSAGTSAAVLLVAVALMFKIEPRIFLKLSLANRASTSSLLGTAGWNTLVVTAVNLHIRLDQFIMNIAFGPVGNAIFTLGIRLTGYVWQLAGAATDGLDAVSARISSSEKTRRSIADMLYHTTRLQAAITIPASLIVLVMADPLIVLWIGRTTDDPTVIPKAVVVARILAIGMIAKGLSQVWMRLLYGAGHIRRYAPLVLCGGALNPILAVILIYLLPANVNYIGPAVAFASAFVIFHFLLLPIVVARCMEVTLQQVLQPLLKPTVATIISGPVLLIPYLLDMRYSPIVLVAALVLFGAIWSPLGWWYVLDAADRKRLSNAIRKRLPRGTKRFDEPAPATAAAPLEAQPTGEMPHAWGVGDEPDEDEEFLDPPPADRRDQGR